ncbi:MAG: isochorismatase family protein [Nitrososphaerales archaeon]|jgi:nicotinamidase/pyrazinamidase
MALLVVDVQRDFCPGGAVAVKEGGVVVPRLNMVIGAFTRASLPIFFTRDWHPPNHMSFMGQGGTWPPHCVKETPGAEFHPKLRVPQGAVVVSKGTEADREAYSGFQGTDLEKRIKATKAREVFLGGLATDYCVKETALDALDAGLKVKVLEDCIRGVNLRENDSGLALREVVARGAELVTSSDAVRLVARVREFHSKPRRPRLR